MHRSIVIACPPAATAELVPLYEASEHVLFLAVFEGRARKPAGDVIELHVLNLGADDVLRAADRAGRHGEISIATEEAMSLIHPGDFDKIADDVDEAQWEEMETGLRHHGRLTANFAALCVLGGVVAAAGLLEEASTQATLLIASSIVTPVYEPMAKLPLGIVLRRGGIVRRGLVSTVVGYALVAVSAALALRLLLALGVEPKAFFDSYEVERLARTHTQAFLAEGAAALAGGVMVASFRRSVIAGPLIALAVVPAAAMGGMGLAIGRPDYASDGFARLGIGVLLVVLGGLAVFAWKARTVHRRKALV